MTPKEKAEEIVDKFIDIENKYKEYTDFIQAKQCALIAVDEIQNTKAVYVNDVEYDYWEQVKQEIEKL